MVIRSVVVPRMVATVEELERVKAMMLELGCREGEGWSDSRSRGVPMMTDLGVMEFFHGQPPAAANVIVEVEDVAKAAEIVRRHGMKVLADISRTHWGANLFVASVGGCHVAFFTWAEAKSEPQPKAA
jgi:hypothetical protein